MDRAAHPGHVAPKDRQLLCPPDFAAVFQAAPGPYLLLAPDAPTFTILGVNDAYLRATNTKRDGPHGIVGRPLFEVFPDNPDDKAATGETNLRASLAAVIQTRAAHAMAVQKYDIPRPAAEGGGFEERFWSPINTPVTAPSGQITVIIHHVSDVTEAARMARVLDAEGQAARALRNQNAWLEAEIRRRNEAEAARDSALAIERRLTEQLQENSAELERQVSEAQAMAVELETSNEELAEALVVVERSAEAERRSNERLHALMEQSPLAIAVFDTKSCVTAWNPGAERMFGWSAAEAIGQTSPHVPIDREGEVLGFRDQCLDGAQLNDVTTIRCRKDGSLVDVSLSTAALHGPSGDIVGLVAFYTDITERRRLEAQLLQAQKMEAVGQLAGGVAHDFNNMLTAIKAYGDLLLAALEKDDPRRDDALEVTKAADRAAALTRQLLAFSRRQVLEPRVLDVNRVITELEQMLRRLLVGDVEIGMELDPSLWAVLADASQLEQVLVNLVVNARDAMPHGGSLTIRTENVVVGAERSAATTHVPAKPGKYVRLSVTDSGVGMTPETQARMFEPFYTTKERGKGTGLGLSTVYGIVHQSGGDIGVTSMLGQGTTFDIFLPRADAVPTPRPTTPTVSRPSGRPTTVLVVDDDAAIRQAVRRMLSAEGYQVIEAANGREAIAEVERIGDQIGILVTDVMMPEMSGRELARAARERLPDVGVLLTSGYDDARGTGPDIAEQGFAFLAKPFRAVSLLDAVARLLGPHATPEKG